MQEAIDLHKVIEILKDLETIAAQTIHEDNDDFMVYDYFGGNFDDAYAGGVTAGEVLLAREIMEKLKQPIEPNRPH